MQIYTPYEGPISTNQNDRKLGVLNRKCIEHGAFDKYLAKINRMHLENVLMHSEEV